MLKEIDTYLDILSGERDFPEIGAEECLETCPPNCDEHKWYCVYWIRLKPQEVLYSDTYYDYNELDITIVWSDSITNAYKGEYHAKDLKPETLEAIYKDIVGEE